jgi:hypothetical protein
MPVADRLFGDIGELFAGGRQRMVAAMTLTGVARRRALAAALAGTERPHDTLLKPLVPGSLIKAREQDFLGSVLRDLKAANWQERFESETRQPTRGDDGIVELALPIHREFTLVALEAHCKIFGMPRLDPKRIESAGLVIRRMAEPQSPAREAWMSAGPHARGWVTLTEPDADPDPAHRTFIRTGHAAHDAQRHQVQIAGALTEREYPLFVAPPDVCAALGKTVLCGLVPVASSETCEEPTAPPDYSASSGELAEHLGMYFSANIGHGLPFERQVLHGGMINGEGSQPFHAFFVFVRMLVVECDAFGTSPEAAHLRAVLAKLQVGLVDPADGSFDIFNMRTMPADQFLAAAARYLLTLEENTEMLRMPYVWPAMDEATAAQLKAAAVACVAARFGRVIGPRGMFDDENSLYEARAFIRVACEPGCPGRIIWAEPSPAYRILPWWAGASQTTPIPLPDVMNAAVRRKLKPGVAFQLPASLASFLNQDHSKTLAGGKLKDKPSLGLDWICSFSIPIITICAFILLTIIIALLDIVFRWIPFVRICLPVPKKVPKP